MEVISSVEAAAAKVPLRTPVGFSTRKVTERHYLLVRIRVSDGSHGIGFAYAGSVAGTVALNAAVDLFAPVILGQDPMAVEALWARMYAEGLLHARAGSAMRALSALDIALWDRNARACGVPLWRYLGGTSTDSVPAYASGGYYRPDKSIPDLQDEMSSYVDMGFNAVKIKVGALPLAEDAARVEAVRVAIGPDVHLMLDANNAWSDVAAAERFVRRCQDANLYWIEEPFGPDDIDNHRRLAQRVAVPVATGEIEVGRWRHRELLLHDAVHILQSDVAVCGGISEWRKVAAVASAFGIPMCPHWFHDVHVHLVAATSNAQYVEYFPDDSVLNFRILIDRQLEVAEGGLQLPSGVGLGFEFDESAVDAFSNGWVDRR